MKVTCPYCENLFNDTLENCPSCGAPNPGVVRKSGDQPITIEELQAWYESKGLPPYETTRFFIGVDYQKPRAFGIYKDERTGNFIVYKNKDNGSRAIRYQGTDEAYAVNELFQRLKQEIIQQKAANTKKRVSVSAASTGKRSSKRGCGCLVVMIAVGIIALVFLFTFIAVFLDDSPDEGYYQYGNTIYYHLDDDDWYYYDDTLQDWYYSDDADLPEEFDSDSTAEDFYYTPAWDSSTQVSDFTESDAYDDYWDSKAAEEESSSWDDNDDYDYDWDSGDSWDSGSSDWDSDW